ncbi:hypothetical protein [Phytohalomonas tamaricis]|uniref:hypothetical protein n=1 Tax=Phytohalomonas tamaricis TaxID=2081032 RepID=UPI000D0B8C4C|nr:hypothetical protein [Phytohalomonas tamaricis]
MLKRIFCIAFAICCIAPAWAQQEKESTRAPEDHIESSESADKALDEHEAGKRKAAPDQQHQKMTNDDKRHKEKGSSENSSSK